MSFFERRYITRIPVNSDYTRGQDISNMYIFVSSFSRKSTKRMAEHGRFIVETLAALDYWPGNTWAELSTLPEESFVTLAERFTHAYDNVERMDTTKYGKDTTFQHDSGSFGTDTRKVFTA